MDNNILLNVESDEAEKFVSIRDLRKSIKDTDLKITVENWKITVKGNSDLILHKLNDIKSCFSAAIEEEYFETCEVTWILF